MKKLFFALAVSLSALTACTKDNSRDQFIGNYSIVITDGSTTLSGPNQTCSITASSTGDSNITLNGMLSSIVTATVNESTLEIPNQTVGNSIITGTGTMDINKNIQITYTVDISFYNAILTRI